MAFGMASAMPPLLGRQFPEVLAMTEQTYDFLKQPLSPGEHGFGGGQYIEPVMRSYFGTMPEAPELEGDEDYRALVSLHALAEKTWRGVITTIEQVRTDDDPSLNRDARLKIVGQVVEPKVEAVAQTASRELARVKAAVEGIQAKVEQAVRVADPIDVAVHADIRSHFKALEPNMRMAAAHTAINEGDTRTLQALATAPAYLCGLAHPTGLQLHAQIKAVVAERMAPDLVRREKRLQEGLAIAAQALSALDTRVNRTIDMHKARQLRERAKVHA